MTPEFYERIRIKLFGGYKRNPFAVLISNRAGITVPIQGTDEEFCQILYELAQGEPNKRSVLVSCDVAASRKALHFIDGYNFSIVKTKGSADRTLVVVSPRSPSSSGVLSAAESPLGHLVAALGLQTIFFRISGEYKKEERRIESEKAAEERRVRHESSIDAALKTIEASRSGETIMIRGMQNIDALTGIGFTPGLVANPDNWIDAEDFPGMWYRHAKSGIELIMTAREKFRPIEELNRLELYFLVSRSDDHPALFRKMRAKFRETKGDGSPYSLREFHDDLIALVRYPDELKCRTEEDLTLMADEVDQVIDRRQEMDRGILPYEAMFRKDTRAIVAHILENGTSPAEIRKALDYFEYTGMIDGAYKETLDREIKAALSGETGKAEGDDDFLHTPRVKEIVTEVLKKLSREQLTQQAITMALAPYVLELGFSKLVKIRERILELRDQMHNQFRQ